MGNWPNSIHFLTNYGLFIYDFSKDLRNITFEEIKGIAPDNVRLIRLDYDEINGEVV
jgi:hypothetical protein